MSVNTIAAMKTDSMYISVHQKIGCNAAKIRERKDQTQAFAADHAGVDRSALNKFESGKYNPSVEWLCKLADGLDVPVIEFFAGLEGSAPGNFGKAKANSLEER